MKKIILFLMCILLVSVVSAKEICIVAQFDEDTVKGDCISLDDGTDGYSALEESDLDFTWSDEGVYGRALCKIDGDGDGVLGTSCQWGDEYWGFYLVRDNTWTYLPVGFDAPGGCWNGQLDSYGGHYCTNNGDVLGFRYGEFGTLPDMLRIDDIKIYVDGDKSSADEDGDTIKEVLPESEIEIKIKLENLYPNDVEIDIEDVTAEFIIEDIDDGDEIEEESDEVDIEADDSEVIELSFMIPLEVEDDTYDATLTITAEDEAGIDYEKELNFEVRVEKERHEVRFLKADLYPESIKCEGSTTLEIDIANTGKKEEEVLLKIVNSDLGIDMEDMVELDDDPFDDDSRFEKTYLLDVAGVKKGIYPISITTEYEDEQENEIVNLEIEECTVEQGKDEKEETKHVVVVEKTEPKKSSFLQGYKSAIFVIGIVLIGIIAFAVSLYLVLKK